MTSDRGPHLLDHERDRFRARLRDALRLEAQRSGVRPRPALLRVALDQPDELPRPRWVAPIAAVAVVGAFVLAVLTLAPGGEREAGLGSTASATTRAGASAVAVPAPITLADCQIYPEDARLAFSGWATREVLKVSGGAAKPGQPVYAIVTRGLAEWMGWRSPDPGPIFPAPVGRMGCILDPSTGEVSQIGVPMDWQPPATIDGCPASPEDEYAGYREIGGPRAWALLPTGPSGWVSGERAIILYRLSPALAADETLSAWGFPLDGGERVDGTVDTVSRAAPSGDPHASVQPAEFSYYVIEQPLVTSGCWVLNVAINGELAGSAITSVAAP